MLAGWQGERGEWAAASRFHSLCVSLFDQASPGPQDGFDTSSRRTKRPLSVLSPPRPPVTHRHPLDKQRRGLGSGPQGGLGGPLKARATPLAVDKQRHNGNAALVATEMGEKQSAAPAVTKAGRGLASRAAGD